MKIDKSKIKKSNSELPEDCKSLIDRLKTCSHDGQLQHELESIKTWTYGKCELYHWSEILDMFDDILLQACKKDHVGQWRLPVDVLENSKMKRLLLQVLHFTSLLIEHSFSRHLYNSMEYLNTLLSSSDMTIILAVLNLLYVFSKRSNYVSRLQTDKRQALLHRLTYLAESWGGKENGFGLAQCCQELSLDNFPSSATTLHFEFYAELPSKKEKMTSNTSTVNCIHMEQVHKQGSCPAIIMEEILQKKYKIPDEKKMVLFTHLRLAHSFPVYEQRLKCVQARLQALSILVYSSAIQDNVSGVLYNGLIEELVDILELGDTTTAVVDIKAASLRTLTSIIHLERNPKISIIIDATGASSYHGFLPTLVRNCIKHMIDPDLQVFPQSFATALFSFLYHLASYESGGESLVSCGMMESLLKVINWYGDGQDHITFVTRSVRVVDLITNLDMQAFQNHTGLSAFINRLEHEVQICRNEQPFVIKPPRTRSDSSVIEDNPQSPLSPSDTGAASMLTESMTSSVESSVVQTAEAMDVDTGDSGTAGQTSGASAAVDKEATTSAEDDEALPDYSAAKTGLQCYSQRAALLKSMLNFLKKAIPDPAFSDSMRHLMDGLLPRSLKHVISNAEYYGPSLFLLATDVVTVYVLQDPSLLSSLQDNGLTDVVLHALLIKDVPATREVLASLPNVFSALCLNHRGLQSFVKCRPFERLFKVLLSTDYLPAMRRRRSSDPLGDTASNLGNAMDELMRHQPSLRTDATKAIRQLLEEVVAMGRDPQYICHKQSSKIETATTVTLGNISSAMNDAGVSSDDDDDDDDGASMASQANVIKTVPATSDPQSSAQEKTPIPLMDYVLNVMKFVEAILSNNTTDDHCREFVQQKGLEPLLSILGLPNLPIDFPSSPSCQAVASVCKSILTLSREPEVFNQGIHQLNEVLVSIQPLHTPMASPGGSLLLHEFVSAPNIAEAALSPSATPLLHKLTSVHAYITMFVHVCKVGQADMRAVSVNHWGSEIGLEVLKGLSELYKSLVWESTVLLALCSEDIIPKDSDFGRADMDKLVPNNVESIDMPPEKEVIQGSFGRKWVLTRSIGEMGPNGVSAAMEGLSTAEGGIGSPMELDSTEGVPTDPTSPPVPSATDTASSSTQKSSSTQTEDKGKPTKAQLILKHQMHQIKPLLSASAKLGRALAELFGLLVKLSVGSPVRQRRSHHLPPPIMIPSQAAHKVTKALSVILSDGLRWEAPPISPVPKLRLTFYICTIGYASSMLFDDKKQPYHLMLQKFYASGAQDALFESFNWALSCGGKVPLDEGLEYSGLPDGTGEFLDAWLMLVEKMVNTKLILESQHTLPPKSSQEGFVPFSPVKYLVHTQKAAFNAIMKLWGKKPLKVHGARICESILVILSHIIKGESTIKEKLVKERGESGKTAGASTSLAADAAGSSSNTSAALLGAAAITAAAGSSVMSHALQNIELQVNQDHLQQLMDMGFTRQHCMNALVNTTTLEQATDYILTHAPPLPTSMSQEVNDFVFGVDMSEEDIMARAIAMSLTPDNETAPAPPSVSKSQEELDKIAAEEKKKKVLEEKKREMEREMQKNEDPLKKEVVDEFTDNIMLGCLSILDTLPAIVHRVCELLVVIASRNSQEWMDSMLNTLVNQIKEIGHNVSDSALPLTTSDKKSVSDWAEQISKSDEASRLAVRLHLFTLLSEEMRLSCARIVQNEMVLDLCLSLMDIAHRCMSVVQTVQTPKWLATCIILIDQYEKMSLASKRKAQLDAVMPEQHIWKWFEDRSGRWSNYSIGNNKTIDDAYKAGESSIRFTAGRRRYTLHFSTMIQYNEETGNRRPVMLALLSNDEKEKVQKKKEEKGSAKKEKDEVMEMDEKIEKEENKDEVVIAGLTPDHCAAVVRHAVGLISIPVEPDSLHAIMRLTLRVMRDHSYAKMFGSLGGHKILLGLTQASSFQGYSSLATLLIRHIIEDPDTLKHTIEKVVQQASQGIHCSVAGVQQGTTGSRELNYVLRVLAPIASRDPELLKDVVKTKLRIAVPATIKLEEMEARLTGPNGVQVVKSNPEAKLGQPPPVSDLVRDVLIDLMTALIAKYDEEEIIGEIKAQTLAEAIQEVVTEVTREITERQSIIRSASSTELQQEETSLLQGAVVGTRDQTMSVTVEGDKGATDEILHKKKNEEDLDKKAARRPLMPKSIIMRVLAEIIRSYPACAKMILEYKLNLEHLEEESTVFAYVLDNLLPPCQTSGDRDCPPLARMLIAAVASCNHCQDAQTALALEVKSAIHRALTLPESSMKHMKIQALMGVISTMMESCPSQGQVPPNMGFKPQQIQYNQMVKLLIKKGLVTDIARIPHSIDLSSPNMPNTINAMLKPLETLSRIVNQPQQTIAKPKGKVSIAEEATAIIHEPATTTTDTQETTAMRGEDAVTQEGDVHIEDVSEGGNNEHDDLEVTEPRECVEPTSQEEMLQDVLDELLNDGGDDGEGEVLGELVVDGDEVMLEVDVDGVNDDHDSQMITQVFSDAEREDSQDHSDIEDGVDHEEDDEGGSDMNDEGDDDDDDGDNVEPEDDDDAATEEDDDDDLDDDDDDDDDDEDDYSGGDEPNFHDDLLDNPFARLHDDDELLVQLEDMFPGFGGQHVVLRTGNTFPMSSYQIRSNTNIDQENGNDINLFPTMPMAPHGVPTHHPLLVRADSSSATGAMSTRSQRNQQRRGTFRYNPSTQTLHVQYVTNGNRTPNPPAILQRLLGQSTANDLLSLTSNIMPSHNLGGPSAHVTIASDHRGGALNIDEEYFEDYFYNNNYGYRQNGYPDSVEGTPGVLASVPSALTRWTEEARILDTERLHDAVTIVKPDIMDTLEKYRDEEIAERRDKKKKEDEEKSNNKEKGKKENVEKDNHNKTIEWSVNMEATPSTTEPATSTTTTTPSTTAAATHTVSTTITSTTLVTTGVGPPVESQPAPLRMDDFEPTSSEPEPEVLSSFTSESSSDGSLTGLRDATSTAEHIANAMVEEILRSSNTNSTNRPTTSASLLPPFQTPVTSSVDSARFFNPLTPMTSSVDEHGAAQPVSTSRIFAPLMSPEHDTEHTAGLLSLDVAGQPSRLHPIFPPLTTASSDTLVSNTPTTNVASAPPPSYSQVAPSIPDTNVPMRLSSEDFTRFMTARMSRVLETPATSLPMTTPQAPFAQFRQSSQMAPTPAPFFNIEAPPETPSTTPAAISTTTTSSDMPLNMTTTSAASGTTSILHDRPHLVSLLQMQDHLEALENSISTLPSLPPAPDLVPPSSINMPATTSSSNIISSSAMSSLLAELANVVTSTLTPTVSTSSSAASSTSTTVVSSGATTSAGTSSSRPGVPEGVDPSFLAALPENIRQEVISEQLRLQRIQERAQQQNEQAESSSGMVSEVNPEFLAALPPSIQEEVLAQQRLEQARIQQESAAPVSDAPVDTISFFASMPSSLRQQVLSDMDDSMIAVLPPDLAQEAQSLRRDLEERHRRMMQERFFSSGGSLSAMLRQSGLASRLGTRYAVRAPGRGGRFTWGRTGQTGSANQIKSRGRHLLDHEAITCLLILLFLDEPKLNTNRLHRVIKNLCYHTQSRVWMIRALLVMLQRTTDSADKKLPDSRVEMLDLDVSSNSSIGGTTSRHGKSSDKAKRKSSLPMTPAGSQESLQRPDSATRGSNPSSWLSLSIDAALGCRTNVFQVSKTGKRHVQTASHVTIHPHASPMVCRHVLDLLISLAKHFPQHFIPSAAKAVTVDNAKDSSGAIDNNVKVDTLTSIDSSKAEEVKCKETSSDSKSEHRESDFWELLVKLDSQTSKKGKSLTRAHSSQNIDGGDGLEVEYESSPMGELMKMLSHPVVRKSQLLTDRLLRLLSLISVGLHTVYAQKSMSAKCSATSAGTTTVTTSAVTTVAATVTTSVVTSVVSSAVTSVVSSVQATSASSSTTPSITTVTPSVSTPISSIPPPVDINTEIATPDAGMVSTPITKEDDKIEQIESKPVETNKKVEDYPVLADQIQLAVQVMTSKSCSEEGLEDATSLLMALSKANSSTRELVLNLLLGGARDLGNIVCQHIKALLVELVEMSQKAQVLGPLEEEDDVAGVSVATERGILIDRFAPNEKLVVSAPIKVKGGRDLNLPSMNQLTNKTSSQKFFIRLIKVIIQLREAIVSEAKKDGKRLDHIMELIGHLPRRGQLSSSATQPTTGLVQPDTGGNQSSAENVQSTSDLAPSATEQTQSQSSIEQSQAPTESPQSTVQETQSNTEGASSTTGGVSSTTEGAQSNTEGAQSNTEGTQSNTEGTQSTSEATQSSVQQETPMETEPAPSTSAEGEPEVEEVTVSLPNLSDQLLLDELWDVLGDCLTALSKTPDHHAVLILQPTVEAFFLVHAGSKEKDDIDGRARGTAAARRESQLAHLSEDFISPASPGAPSGGQQLTRETSVSSVISVSSVPSDVQKFILFAETHRTVLNQILRQSTMHLADGPFAVLVDHTRILDFDVKRRYFRTELERIDDAMRREDLAIHIRRDQVFEDSFRDLHRRNAEEWKHRFYIVFEGEEGQDAGGLLREWYLIISREIFNPNYALFRTSPGDRVTYTINPSSHYNHNHLSYFKFVGRIIAKAIYDNKLLECFFTRSFYKHILGVFVKYTDMESEDYSFYQGLAFLTEHHVDEMGYELTFSTEINEFGVTEVRDLKENGRNIAVTEDTKLEYIKLVCQMKMTGAVRKQLAAFLEGFYDIIPKRLISIFNEQELELLISGLPVIDIEDLKANSEYHKYQSTSLQVQWFWRALKSFDQAERARFLQFVTGTSKVPLQGFSHLEGMNGTQKFQIHRDDRSTDRLPCAHTCFNQLDLPAYETYTKLRKMLLLAFNEGSEGFGLA